MGNALHLELGFELALSAFELLDIMIAGDCILDFYGCCTAQYRKKGQHIARLFEHAIGGGVAI